MLRKLYDWAIAMAGHRHALPALGIVSFLESWIFPIPPDAMLIPMAIARPDRAYLAAGICLAGSILGALTGYLIGATLFEQLGQPLLEIMDLTDRFEELAGRYNEQGFWAVFVAGLTPFPFKIITILSGSTGLSLPLFVLSCVFARGLRFFIVAALLVRYGDSVRALVERHFGIATIFACLVLLVAILALRAG